MLLKQKLDKDKDLSEEAKTNFYNAQMLKLNLKFVKQRQMDKDRMDLLLQKQYFHKRLTNLKLKG